MSPNNEENSKSLRYIKPGNSLLANDYVFSHTNVNPP